MIDFAKILRIGQDAATTPAITIKKRETDLSIVYDKKRTRLDRISYNIYKDETFWRVIMMANPEYFCEYDIPDQTVIRVPFPLNEVSQELVEKYNIGKFREDLQK